MTNHKKTWETYSASWAARTLEEKHELYARSLSPSCRYTDPLAQTNGYDELAAYMLKFHEQVPGGYFKTIEFMAHHDRSLAKWEMRDASDKKLGDGVSYGEYDADGKLVAMNGFFEVPPS